MNLSIYAMYVKPLYVFRIAFPSSFSFGRYVNCFNSAEIFASVQFIFVAFAKIILLRL